MSHDATNWAIRQKGLKPAAKIVLWHLCDRYHPDHGCFPSLDTLAKDCEMSRRSVQDHLAALEASGMIRIDKMERMYGQLPRNRYVLAFENCLEQNLPWAKSALGKNEYAPLADSRESLGQNLPPNSVIGTSNITSKARDALCEVLSEETADAFIAHRKASKSSLTEHAARLIAKKLRGHPKPDAVVEQSIMNGWKGVFPDAAPVPFKPDFSKYGEVK